MNPYIGIGVGAFARAAVDARQRERDQAYRDWQMNFQERQLSQQMLMDELQRKQLQQSMDINAEKFDWAKQDRPRDIELQTANIDNVKLGNKRTEQLYNQSEEMFPITKQSELLKNQETEENINFAKQYHPKQIELVDEQITGAKETNRHAKVMNPAEEYGQTLKNKQDEITLKYLPQKEQAEIARLNYRGENNSKSTKTGYGMTDKQFQGYISKEYSMYKSSVNTRQGEKILPPEQWLKTKPAWMYRRWMFINSGNTDAYYAETPLNQDADAYVSKFGGVSDAIRQALWDNANGAQNDDLIDRLVTRYNENIKVQNPESKIRYSRRDWEATLALANKGVTLRAFTPSAIPDEWREQTDFAGKKKKGYGMMRMMRRSGGGYDYSKR